MNNTESFKTKEFRLPSKLIVVGMRYQSTSVMVRLSLLKEEKYLKEPVFVKKEINPEGSNGTAWSVHFIDGTRVGYIREKDRDLLDKLNLDTGLSKFDFLINQVMDNWLLLIPRMAFALVPIKQETKWVGKEYPIPKEVSLGKPETCILGFEQEYKADFNNNTNKEDSKMLKANSMRDSFFREVSNAVIELTTGKFGISTSEGIATYNEGTVTINPITEMGISFPAFAMRVDVKTLKEGDMIVTGSELNFFKAATDDGYSVVSLKGEVKQVGNIANLFFGKNTVLAVKNMAGTDATTEGGMNPMMLAMMMGDKEDNAKGFDMKTFALMSMMSGSKGMDSNIMMMMALMGK